MTRLLYIKASPRAGESRSAMIADAYLAALRNRLPDLEVDTLDVWQERLPEFDGNKAAAKLAIILGQSQDKPQKTAWDEIATIAERFIAADRYLISVPMWNSGIPYRLKQYIDLIHQPGLLIGLNPQTGYFGLLKDKKAVLTLTSGAYGPAMPSPAFGTDHHSTYLRDWLNQAGVTDIADIRFQPTLLTADPEGELKKALESAALLGARG